MKTVGDDEASIVHNRKMNVKKRARVPLQIAAGIENDQRADAGDQQREVVDRPSRNQAKRRSR